MRPSLNSVRLTKRCPNTFTKKSISPWAVPVQMVIWCRLELWLVSTIPLQALRSCTAPPTVSHYGVAGTAPRNTTPPSLPPPHLANILHLQHAYISPHRPPRDTTGTTRDSPHKHGKNLGER